uniref:Double-stranded ribonuclease 2 n=1 Tax=Diabrotica virgifera virgifera TaxID=50390 RepID=A0A7G7Y241_DIAVI|nr:double-stranded ribonuclease 2 [Diabrotica virgifera virgifera]
MIYFSKPFLKSRKFFLIVTGVVVGIVLLIIIIVAASETHTGTKSSNVEDHTDEPNEPSGPCEINQIQYRNTHPLLLSPKTDNVIYPQGKANTIFASNEEVEFSCSQSEVRANGVNLGSNITVVCKSNETFTYNGTNIEWKNVACSKTLVPTIKEVPVQNLSSDDPNKPCDIGDDSTIFLNLGYTVDLNRFISIVNICFNTTNKIALYSHYILTSVTIFGSRNVTRSNIRQEDSLYKLGYSVKTVYDDSKKTMNNLLGLPDDSDKYINNKIFITPQQLASENDFYLATFQLAVKNYANIAPQWNSINKGNWLQENEIRLYASNNNVNLQIWSGTYGVTKLNNETEPPEPTELYLLEKELKNGFVIAFPVPELYWKVVYNPLNTQGLVLIGHNNPYVDKVNPEEQICEDISSKISWISWDKELYEKGYFYACDYNDDGFHNTVNFAPNLKVTGYL